MTQDEAATAPEVLSACLETGGAELGRASADLPESICRAARRSLSKSGVPTP